MNMNMRQAGNWKTGKIFSMRQADYGVLFIWDLAGVGGRELVVKALCLFMFNET